MYNSNTDLLGLILDVEVLFSLGHCSFRSTVHNYINITIPPACGGRGDHPVAGQARLGRGRGAASQAGSAATPPGAGCVRRWD